MTVPLSYDDSGHVCPKPIDTPGMLVDRYHARFLDMASDTPTPTHDGIHIVLLAGFNALLQTAAVSC